MSGQSRTQRRCFGAPVFGLCLLPALFLMACDSAISPFGAKDPTAQGNGPYAPGVNRRQKAVSGLEVGHRLMAAGEHELALEAYLRAYLEDGPTAEVLSSLGSANLGLGRVDQAEDLLRRALKEDPSWPEALNNLGAALLQQGRTAEAEQYFRRAYALDNGESDAIRDNLRRTLEMLENSDHTAETGSDFNLVQYGGGVYRIQQTP